MIELHKTQHDKRGDEIAEKLNDLVVAHRIYTYSHNKKPKTPLPYISDSGKIFSGKEDTERFLDELESMLSIQRSISSDACYIDPETGETC